MYKLFVSDKNTWHHIAVNKQNDYHKPINVKKKQIIVKNINSYYYNQTFTS